MTQPLDNPAGSPPQGEQRCGKFVLHRRLGAGGMAEVFLAEMTGPSGFGKRVALKRLLPHVAADEEFIDSFISEARLGGALEHPNIVQTLELGQDGPTWYLAMELVQGLSLTTLIRLASRRQLELSRAVVLEITRQLCAGLAYAHTATDARGRPLHIIHRDLKPANILINRFGQLKICDFGIARSAAAIRHTLNSGVLKGTVSYMSPEQAACMPLDQRSDLYSLGSILFELLTLQPLYPGGGGMPGLYDVMKGDISQRLPLLEGQPPVLVETIRRLLAYDPGQRPERTEAVLEALHPLLLVEGSRPEALGAVVNTAMGLSGHGEGERSFSLSESDQPPASRVIPLGRDALAREESLSMLLEPASQMRPAPGDGGAGARPRGPLPPTQLNVDVRGAYGEWGIQTPVSQPSLVTRGPSPGVSGSYPSSAGGGSGTPPLPPQLLMPGQRGAAGQRHGAGGPSAGAGGQPGSGFESGHRLPPAQMASSPVWSDDASRPPPGVSPAGQRPVGETHPQGVRGTGQSAPIPPLNPAASAPQAHGSRPAAEQGTFSRRGGWVLAVGATLLLAGVGVYLAGGLSTESPPSVSQVRGGDENGKADAVPVAAAITAVPVASVQAVPADAAPVPVAPVPVAPVQAVPAQAAPAPAAPTQAAPAQAAPPQAAPPQAAPAPAAPREAPSDGGGGAGSRSNVAKTAKVTGKGYLTVNARPYAYVFVNGKRLPEPTPLFDFPVESGSLQLMFRTEDGQSHGPIRVELKPGEHKRLPAVVFER